jgi:hypothetical protein
MLRKKTAVISRYGARQRRVMAIRVEVSREEAEALRDLLRARILELDKEISRTDNLDFKASLRQLDRTMERLLENVSGALEL